MKNIFTIILLIIITASCSELEDKSEEQNNVVEITLTTNQFNDSLVSHLDKAELFMEEIWEMDNLDAPKEDVIIKAEQYLNLINISIQEIENLKPVGEGGNELLKAAIQHMYSFKIIFNTFIEYAYILEIPDEEWDSDMITVWMNEAEPVFNEYEITFSILEKNQINYAIKNDFDIVP